MKIGTEFQKPSKAFIYGGFWLFFTPAASLSERRFRTTSKQNTERSARTYYILIWRGMCISFKAAYHHHQHSYVIYNKSPDKFSGVPASEVDAGFSRFLQSLYSRRLRNRHCSSLSGKTVSHASLHIGCGK